MIGGFMGGCMVVLLGILKVGKVMKFIAGPVIIGFTGGIGVIIFS
ncbi:SulP family inorganic anion transporter, partial [Bacillus altitudinis]